MRVLTVPNWSFGRDKSLLREFRDELEGRPVVIHYVESDVDHNRTVSAFSGEQDVVADALFALAEMAFPSIDLNRHLGVHPRIGALDVCPFVPLKVLSDEEEAAEFVAWIERFAESLADRHGLPVYLYERSEKGRHSSELPELRKGGFGSLLAHELNPDFGPREAHPRLGATVSGWRDFLVAMNVNLREDRADMAKTLARKIRIMRNDGDERFLGVRALGLMLATRGESQVSMNLT
ncbi:MAG: glutamate formiminotransferase, partial [Fimbriimonadaceae bacterium]